MSDQFLFRFDAAPQGDSTDLTADPDAAKDRKQMLEWYKAMQQKGGPDEGDVIGALAPVDDWIG